jgi:hypothetical protein
MTKRHEMASLPRGEYLWNVGGSGLSGFGLEMPKADIATLLAQTDPESRLYVENLV